MAAFTFNQSITPDTAGSKTVIVNGQPESIAKTVTYGPLEVRPESRQWEHNTDKDLSGYLNFRYKAIIAGNKTIFSAGGMFRHKTRDNFDNSYSLNPTPDA